MNIYDLLQATTRVVLHETDAKYHVGNVSDAVKFVESYMINLDREHVIVVNLDAKLHPLNWNIVSIGDINGSQAYIPNIFKTAILSNASSVIMFHNHPSGDPTPSKQDVAVTSKVIAAGRLLDIPLIDHIIIAPNTYNYSFKGDNGILWA